MASKARATVVANFNDLMTAYGEGAIIPEYAKRLSMVVFP